MFYLRFSLNIMKAKFLRVFGFILVTTLMLLSFSYKQQVQGYFDGKFKLKEQEIYFNALIKSSIPTNSLRHKMVNLPGVTKVTITPSTSLQSKLKETLSNVELDLPKEVASTDYQVLKVSLANNINASSLALIKEYLVRVVGESSLTLSSLKRKSGIDKKNSFLVSFLKRVSTAISVFFSTLWFVLFFTISTAIGNEIYLAEKFQRKSNVKIKVFLIFEFCALFPLLCLSAIDLTFEFSNTIIAIVPLALMNLFLLKEIKWRDNR